MGTRFELRYFWTARPGADPNDPAIANTSSNSTILLVCSSAFAGLNALSSEIKLHPATVDSAAIVDHAEICNLRLAIDRSARYRAAVGAGSAELDLGCGHTDFLPGLVGCPKAPSPQGNRLRSTCAGAKYGAPSVLRSKPSTKANSSLGHGCKPEQAKFARSCEMQILPFRGPAEGLRIYRSGRNFRGPARFGLPPWMDNAAICPAHRLAIARRLISSGKGIELSHPRGGRNIMAKTVKKRQKRPGRIVRQAELLTTVYKVVSEFGIDAASMRQIATRAKVSTGTINYHFRNKEKLVMEALQAAYQMTLPEADSSHTPLERLKGFAFGYILHEPNDRFWRFWMNYTVYGSRNEESENIRSIGSKSSTFWTKLVRMPSRG